MRIISQQMDSDSTLSRISTNFFIVIFTKFKISIMIGSPRIKSGLTIGAKTHYLITTRSKISIFHKILIIVSITIFRSTNIFITFVIVERFILIYWKPVFSVKCFNGLQSRTVSHTDTSKLTTERLTRRTATLYSIIVIITCVSPNNFRIIPCLIVDIGISQSSLCFIGKSRFSITWFTGIRIVIEMEFSFFHFINCILCLGSTYFPFCLTFLLSY